MHIFSLQLFGVQIIIFHSPPPSTFHSPLPPRDRMVCQFSFSHPLPSEKIVPVALVLFVKLLPADRNNDLLFYSSFFDKDQ